MGAAQGPGTERLWEKRMRPLAVPVGGRGQLGCKPGAQGRTATGQ